MGANTSFNEAVSLIERNTPKHCWRLGMTTLVLETEPLATTVTVTDEKLIIDLVDGRSLAIPLSWYPRLAHTSPQERQNWQLLGDGLCH
jgi:hypothetical protein